MKPGKSSLALAVVLAWSILCTVPSSSQDPKGSFMGQGPGAQAQGGQSSMGWDPMGMGMEMGGPMGQNAPLDPSIKRTEVHLQGATGYLYEPQKPGDKAHTGIFVMHSHEDYSYFSACTELSKRGYTVLCAKNSGGNLNRSILDAKAAVTYLRQYPGIQKVIFWGHSGGATLMTAYQMIAENGVKVCQGADKLSKCPDYLAGLPAADGLILADSNWGNAEMALFSLDPAVINEDSGTNLNPDLDLFNPGNGFNPHGSSDYSQEFIHKFQSAAAKRESALIKFALGRVAAIDAGKGRFTDDEPLVIPGASQLAPNNKLYAEDTKLMSHTVKAWPLLHADGSIATEIVHSVRRPMGSRSTTPMLSNALNTTVRDFLVDSAIRTTDDYGFDEDTVHGVDWSSTYSSPPGNIKSIKVPLLVMGMTGSWEYLASETIYNNAASTDKSIAFVEGASHMYSTCTRCEKTPGQFGDTIKTLYNYADRWLSKKGRF